MTRNGFGKNELSIAYIGKTRFWIGTVVGIISAVILSYFFNYSREALRFFTSISADLIVLSETEIQFYDLFYASLSTALGLSWTVWIWMGNSNQNRKKERLFKRLAQINALLAFWVTLMCFTRFGTVILIILYSSSGYDDHLNLMDDFWVLFALLPIVVFLQNWFVIRLAYKSGKWTLYSVGCCTLIAASLFFLTKVDQDKVNASYHAQYIAKYNYLESELQKAESKYGIQYDEETKSILSKRLTERSVEQVAAIKQAFGRKTKVSMDTIILAKIVQHNLKLGDWHWHRLLSFKNWHYPYPSNVYHQIKLNSSDSLRVRELLLLLRDQIELWNTPEVSWKNWEEYTKEEREKSNFKRHKFPLELAHSLSEIRDSIMSDSIFDKYDIILPELHLPEAKPRYDINLTEAGN